MALQSLSQIASGIQQNGLPAMPVESRKISISEKDAQVVNDVFERLKVIFPAWQRAFPTPASLKSARQEWTKALVEAGVVTEQALSLGFRIAREKDIPFFPSPGMFIKWCQPSPEALGMPTVDQALHEIAHHKPSHPAVILAARSTRFERETLSATEYHPVFERAYGLLVDRVMAGEPIEAEVPKALPTKSQIQHSPEFYQKTGQRGIAAIKSLFQRGVTE